ncbi:co-regulatory protein PtrA N-terminal domain-containing protein [Pseudomonas sp. RC10]|uniref:co-regulatory protein PtrA N-terminal domain-containing protein n=1 Tax=Pseudomonas bambusae TaxID=3139142 RepID=UPI00313973F4
MKKSMIAMLMILSSVSAYSHAEGGGDTVFERMESLRNAAMEAKQKAQSDATTPTISDKTPDKTETSHKDKC